MRAVMLQLGIIRPFSQALGFPGGVSTQKGWERLVLRRLQATMTIPLATPTPCPA